MVLYYPFNAHNFEFDIFSANSVPNRQLRIVNVWPLLRTSRIYFSLKVGSEFLNKKLAAIKVDYPYLIILLFLHKYLILFIPEGTTVFDLSEVILF